MGAGIRKDRSGLAGLQNHPCTNIFPHPLVSGQHLPEPPTSKSRTVSLLKIYYLLTYTLNVYINYFPVKIDIAPTT